MEAYTDLKTLALKSAADFHDLYASIPDKNRASHLNAKPSTDKFRARRRKCTCILGMSMTITLARLAWMRTMRDHLVLRQRGFAALEQKPGFLAMPAREGSYGEYWSLRKMLRRFLWHDRIHAKAMYRVGTALFGAENIKNPFAFEKGGRTGPAVRYSGARFRLSKTFRRCRRGRSLSDFHSCKPALPASRVVDFACKINSLQIGRPLVDRICFLEKVALPLFRHAETGPAVRYSGAPFPCCGCNKAPDAMGFMPKEAEPLLLRGYFCAISRPCAGRPAGRRGCPSGTWWPRRSRRLAAAFLRR